MEWVRGLTIEKDTDAVKNYNLNLRTQGWLDANDNVFSHTIVDVVGVTVDSSTNDNDSITVWLSNGTVGQAAHITFRPVTTDGVTDDFTVKFTIVEQ